MLHIMNVDMFPEEINKNDYNTRKNYNSISLFSCALDSNHTAQL